MCKHHFGEKVYLAFTSTPKTRDEVPSQFSVVCPFNKAFAIYSRKNVWAEPGITPAGGVLVGALGFAIDPILGLVGLLAGAAAGEKEKKNVEVFNKS